MNELTMRSRKKSKSTWKQMKMSTHQPKPLGHREGSPERAVHNNTGLPKKEKFQINILYCCLFEQE